MPATTHSLRPGTDEFAPYYGRYINLIGDTDILELLANQIHETLETFGALREDQANFRYAPGKWTIKEMVGHMVDTERIMAYRALRFARNDQTPLPGFEQDDYVKFGGFEHCRLADLLAEFKVIRDASLRMFNGLEAEAWTRSGVASGNKMSVRALAYIIAGHEQHHRNILREKYLPAMSKT